MCGRRFGAYVLQPPAGLAPGCPDEGVWAYVGIVSPADRESTWVRRGFCACRRA